MVFQTLISYSVQTLGWLGTLLFIVSYIQLNRGVWTLQDTKFHVYNILGSVFLVIDTVYDFSYAAAAANFFWGIVACYGLIKFRNQEKVKSDEFIESKKPNLI
ncbi:CBU_0592 family membrane protein [Roseivirga seohaensis]|uniref:CBU_0592 family membrane protein n=1 Tax=Roseivirga seohaensis TaxID=1914963 RepID=UPI003BA92D0C